MLPRWELSIYLLASLGFHFYSFYEVYKVSREHEEELDEEFELETDTLFGGLKKDPTDFEWSFWMEWGKQRLVWLLLGHVVASQMAKLLAMRHRPWILTTYGMWACWCVLGAPGVAMVFLHTVISFCVAQFRSLLLSWLCSLLLLSTLRLQGVEEVKRRWYQTENEYYLLQFTLTVRCLYYISFSLEFCWQRLPAECAPYSFPWMLAYVFYYPVFHNGPILGFPEFVKQMQQPEHCSLKASLRVLALGLGRLLCWWWLAELMAHLMYMHAIYSSTPLLEAVSSWALGGLALAQVLFFYVKYLVLFGIPALLMRLDGLKPPPLPRCVSTMFSFTGMWRYFDVGLHNFLIRPNFSPHELAVVSTLPLHPAPPQCSSCPTWCFSVEIKLGKPTGTGSSYRAGRGSPSLSWDSCTATPTWASPGPRRMPWTNAAGPQAHPHCRLHGKWCFT
ncbi:protein-cysteine N-palmitoyltransferase HHAT isoform X7 [Choloepus didactylus]|uniref:protein-cysteine N-palmitoyltransferase HHAT isoform X7 n=1 Tax=Choloepus didactylus TaxID=27675 RepID=UPI00189DB59C|nr:protein-cysteine N-palmitoyltransferase HHAT isoform X7 [Choloepus didactylus]